MTRVFCLLLFCLCSPALANDEVPPFAANLFQGNFAQDKAQAADKHVSMITAGDRVALRLWGGGLTLDDTLVVTNDGLLNVPGVGSIPVGGLSQDALAEALRSKLAASGHQDTQIYVAPLDARPVTVFVTGAVAKPGRYSGSAGDTLLHFLDKAGGIDASCGSYRDIRLLRTGKDIATLDLYPFARRGEQPRVRIQEGDTLVVGNRGPVVTATGAVRLSARFEFPKGKATGSALAELAEPLPGASHIALNGTRQGAPYSTYLPCRELRHLRLEDGDQVRFIADAPGKTIMVGVQGAVRGATSFPVRRGARLQEVQNFIAVEPEANIAAMYIKRKSVAARQKKALADSLRRLEESAMTASSGSMDEASIRAKEADMIAKFIERAKAVEPEGVVVLDGDPAKADLTLEDGDIIVIPAKSDVVLVSGEVMAPQAMLWNRSKDLDDYIASAGGYTTRADHGHILILHPNGAVSQDASDIQPGDQIMALPRVESKAMQSIKDISQVIMQVVVSARLLLGMPSL